MTCIQNEDITVGKIEQRIIDNGPLAGYTEDFNRLYHNGKEIKPGSIVYVKDRFEGHFVEARFVKYCDGEIYASHPSDSNDYTSWRYCYFDLNAISETT